MDVPLVSVLLAAFFTFLIVLALGGNAMVCAAIFWDRHLRKQPENLFLISLAVSDMAVAVLVMIFAAANDLMGYWAFGHLYCKLWTSFDVMCCSASILNLCAIAFDRYWHISNPMRYTRFVNRRRICWMVLCVWLLSAAIGFFQIMYDSDNFDREQSANASNDSGAPDWRPPAGPLCILNLRPVYAIISSMLSFFLPATLMVYLYTKLYLYARMHVRSMQRQLKAVTGLLLVHTTAASVHRRSRSARDGSAGSSSSPQPAARSPGNASLSRKNVRAAADSSKEVSDQKARVTLGVIMGTFLCCWLPFFVVNVVRGLWPHAIPDWLFLVVTWLGYMNSTVNPIIYSIFNKDFRRAFHRVLLETCVCAQKDPYATATNASTPARTPIQLRYSASWCEQARPSQAADLRRDSCQAQVEAAPPNRSTLSVYV